MDRKPPSPEARRAKEFLEAKNAPQGQPPYEVIPADDWPEERRGDAHEPRARPKASRRAAAEPQPPPPKRRILRVASSVPKLTPRWRWQCWMPEGELCILDGDPGLGKSTLTIDLAARLSRGWAMPPFPRGQADAGLPPAGVILILGEDSPEYTVRHRLDAAEADNGRVHFHEGFIESYGDREFDLGGDLDDLELTIRETGAGLVVIDPAMAFLGNGIDAHKDQDIRRLLRPCSKLAQRTRATILLIRHLNKLNGGEALYRGGGSIGIIGAARAAWIAGSDPQDDDLHVLAMNKCNLCAKPAALSYRLSSEGDGLRVDWQGETALKANEILGHGQAKAAGRPDRERGEARRFLADLLSGGPVAASEVRRQAEEAMIPWRTVRRAQEELGINPERDGRGWAWALPPAGQGGHNL